MCKFHAENKWLPVLLFTQMWHRWHDSASLGLQTPAVSLNVTCQYCLSIRVKCAPTAWRGMRQLSCSGEQRELTIAGAGPPPQLRPLMQPFAESMRTTDCSEESSMMLCRRTSCRQNACFVVSLSPGPPPEPRPAQHCKRVKECEQSKRRSRISLVVYAQHSQRW